MMTDPIADMLTRIRNAGQAQHKWVDMPVSKLKIEVAKLLKENAFIFDFKKLDDGKHEGRQRAVRVRRSSLPRQWSP